MAVEWYKAGGSASCDAFSPSDHWKGHSTVKIPWHFDVSYSGLFLVRWLSIQQSAIQDWTYPHTRKGNTSYPGGFSLLCKIPRIILCVQRCLSQPSVKPSLGRFSRFSKVDHFHRRVSIKTYCDGLMLIAAFHIPWEKMLYQSIPIKA